MKRRVFITGLSAVSSAGMTKEENWDSLLNGKSHLQEHPSLPASFENRMAGFVSEYSPATMLPDRKLLKVISRQDVLGIYAAREAINDSGLLAFRETLSDATLFNEKTGIYVGSPGNKYEQQYDFLPLLSKTENMQAFAANLFDEVHPMWLLRILPNNVLAYIGITWGFKGPNHNVTNHAASGIQALLEAAHAIASGEIERAVVSAYDIGPEPQAMFYYNALGLLSGSEIRPFDKEGNGTILAEGAASVVLESEASMRERGAFAYAEVRGGKTAADATPLFSLEKTGERLTTLLEETLHAYGVKASDLSAIVAHANGNVVSDESEARAFSSILGDENHPAITGFKWSMGHTLAASGLLDTVFAALSMKERTLPQIATLKEPASYATHLNIIREQTSLKDESLMLLVNRAFASIQTAVLLASCPS